MDCDYQAMEDAADGYTASYALSGGGENPIYAKSSEKNSEPGISLTTYRETIDESEAADGVTPVTVTFMNKLPEVGTEEDELSVTVTKQWMNADGEDENAAHEGEIITIYLLRTLDPDKLNEGDVIGTAYLNGTDDGWTHTFSNLERYTDGGQLYYYYVREQPVDGYYCGIEAHYGTATDDDGNEVPDYTKDYSFTVTNRTSRELPYTGGTGTIMFTAGGLLILTVALVYGCGLRRKRERRTE